MAEMAPEMCREGWVGLWEEPEKDIWVEQRQGDVEACELFTGHGEVQFAPGVEYRKRSMRQFSADTAGSEGEAERVTL